MGWLKCFDLQSFFRSFGTKTSPGIEPPRERIALVFGFLGEADYFVSHDVYGVTARNCRVVRVGQTELYPVTPYTAPDSLSGVEFTGMMRIGKSAPSKNARARLTQLEGIIKARVARHQGLNSLPDRLV